MESDLKWDLKAQISHQNTITNMRRFSASNFKSFREDERFLRPILISSTVSSPGYTTRDTIDPSTYSFTAAIKALQAKGNACSWEHLPPKRATLHSKWSDAEKYISNPLSGEVPVECLSAKTLSARSFSSLTNRITISGPLLYHPSHFPTKFPIIQHQHKLNITIQEEKKGSTVTRDVGTQSTPVDLSSGSPSTAPPTPTIRERLTKCSEGESGDSSLSNEKEIPKKEGEAERETKEKESRKTKEGRERKKMMMMCIQGGGRRGCLSLKGLLQRDKKCKPRKIKKPAAASSSSSPTFLYHINACYGDLI